MANDDYHYFGAYLEITVNKIKTKALVRRCENGHDGRSEFCSKCGFPIMLQEIENMVYPDHLYELNVDIDEDALAEITPPDMFGKGVILVRDNYVIKNSEDTWLHIGPYRGEHAPSVLQFPTAEEITAMFFALLTAHVDNIERLRQCPAVKSVKPMAGYVYCPEY